VTLITACLILTCIILAFTLSISVYFNIKHGILLLRIQDSVEKSLDVLDAKYSKISEILEIPIFFDSVEVRQVISEIQNARDSVLYVANEITGHSQVLGQRESESDPG
jgi:hypothetical protein|tara:strand:+ start:266 stop:589 length:324 start_codon:yes stop_codon:yes gene_type:complete